MSSGNLMDKNPPDFDFFDEKVLNCPYDFYQNPENYEGNNESRTKETDVGNHTGRNMLKQENAKEAVC